ncbi:putative aliphatic sulfonates transport permease protein SsuC [compost metagenome]
MVQGDILNSVTTASPSPYRDGWRVWLRKADDNRYLQVSLFPLAVLLCWQGAFMLGWVSPIVLPSPAEVLATLWRLASSGELVGHLHTSVMRVVVGFSLGALIGIVLGLSMGISRLTEQMVYPTFRAFCQVPTMAWLPLLMMLFGLGEALKIVIITKAVMVPLCINTFEGVRGIPAKYFEVARVLQVRRRTLLLRLALPAILPPTFSGARQGLSSAWVSLVGVELLASMEGIGYMMNWGRTIFQLDIVLAGVVVVGLVGLAMDLMMARVEARLGKWRVEKDEE